MNKLRVQMIKKADNSVYPCELLAKFFYSERFGYTFIAAINPLNTITPFRNNLSYSPLNLYFLLVENQTGFLMEVSKSFFKLLEVLGFEDIKHTESLDFGSKMILIDDLIYDFNL